ncbi:c-type cytochrome biogenesis protein CcmI [Thiothrix fructosivorans]|uniref:C-type cytochrome biogenesis protein CcmI n=1 Tax=Thiothrix fructosivorans TaxID=111770 RepID=A0A8B0SME4_9GAMM|nr:c-type cytochrome biogenesis protein CcmI [Thiothrix fructosivorans]MBO0615325.1 c-type cytochrome biogenesis protein CcmI [Thiothrix fructosivorans]QTX10102.1 c-type cytochrome biogenesis protein CcmI [Thiothrix fructosivorans]
MTFWMIVFLLVVLTVAGLLIPLLRQSKVQAEVERNAQNIQIAREQLADLERMNVAGELDAAEYHSAKQELERTLLDDVQTGESRVPARQHLSPLWTAMVIGLFVPVAAFGLYGWLGTPEALQVVAQEQGLPADHPPMDAGQQQAPDIGKMVEGLRKKLDANPNNPEGWNMLGRSYMNMERFTDAANAYRKLNELQPDNVDVMLLFADALAMGNDGKVTGEAETLALKALAKAPKNVTALWLAGLGAAEKGDKTNALQHWNTLLPLLADSPAEQSEVKKLIQQLQ